MLKQTLNKGISMPIALGIILVIAVIAGGIVYWQYANIPKEISEMELPDKEAEIKIEEESINCKELYKEIESQFEEANYCDEDSDCKSVMLF
jgi:cell division protein YceG involved in septum cleavage